MKKCVNGEYFEMTEEEINEIEQHLIDVPISKTPEERITELEEIIAALLEGRTE